MEYHRLVWVLFVFVLFMHDGWGQTDRRQRQREKQQRRLAELSRATTSFGVSLYRQLASRNQENIVFSPLSIYTALSMTMLGTYGETKNQLKRVLSLRPRQGVHRALNAVFASFPRSPAANVTLRLANAVYYDDADVVLHDGFTRGLRRHYGAYPKAFERPNPETPINDWVLRQTGGKIEDFLNPGDITSDTVIMLLNAVFFQGTWKDIFDERYTREGDFTTTSGDVVSVPMMSRDGSYSVKAVGDGIPARVLELPYGSDDRFAMFILLPDEANGLRELEGRLSSQVLEEAVTNMPEQYRYQVRMPKFNMRTKMLLKDTLEAMGLTRFFKDADLTRMVRQSNRGPLSVDSVIHEAVLEVDEKGTHAAAVTAIGVSVLSLPPQFAVTHPFLIVLRDKKASINLFMARVNDPSSE
ncbi:serpin B3-like isoform X1 [Littorina saxatilis]|uniref:Serpin domain-containing protein n=1 Tax=Littorina saxatilis TaxID=31220 RepID=A0AAN9G019_9CAEN